jgi:hypothetical protein
VKDLIKKVTRSQDDRKFRMQWFGDIYNGVRGFDVYGPMTAANNALALITYMAMNIGTLSFCVPCLSCWNWLYSAAEGIQRKKSTAPILSTSSRIYIWQSMSISPC